jgi:hypothetical protein
MTWSWSCVCACARNACVFAGQPQVHHTMQWAAGKPHMCVQYIPHGKLLHAVPQIDQDIAGLHAWRWVCRSQLLAFTSICLSITPSGRGRWPLQRAPFPPGFVPSAGMVLPASVVEAGVLEFPWTGARGPCCRCWTATSCTCAQTMPATAEASQATYCCSY